MKVKNVVLHKTGRNVNGILFTKENLEEILNLIKDKDVYGDVIEDNYESLTEDYPRYIEYVNKDFKIENPRIKDDCLIGDVIFKKEVNLKEKYFGVRVLVQCKEHDVNEVFNVISFDLLPKGENYV